MATLTPNCHLFHKQYRPVGNDRKHWRNSLLKIKVEDPRGTLKNLPLPDRKRGMRIRKMTVLSKEQVAKLRMDKLLAQKELLEQKISKEEEK